MAYTLVVEKEGGRITFARDSAVLLYVDDLWPAVTHYRAVYLDQPVNTQMLSTPWAFKFIGEGRVVAANDLNAEELARYQLNERRAILLQVLGRGVDRHRGVGRKSYHLQDAVYAAKLWEAQSYLANPVDVNVDARYPFLWDGAQHSGITVAQEARSILFRRQQQRDILRNTEGERRTFSRRILTAGASDMAQLEKELRAYERRG
jgi:hypothetical protein